MLKIAIILGSTRPGRLGESVARWTLEQARARNDAEYQLLDVADFDLPLLDEPVPPSRHQYTKPHTRAWAAAIEPFDGYAFVTAEYNHSVPGALKNAIDFLSREWHNKAAGFVSYGSAGGTRAVEHLRQIMAELQIADVRAQVALSIYTDFENFSRFKPAARHEQSLALMFDQLLAWSAAMKSVRVPTVPKQKPAEVT